MGRGKFLSGRHFCQHFFLIQFSVFWGTESYFWQKAKLIKIFGQYILALLTVISVHSSRGVCQTGSHLSQLTAESSQLDWNPWSHIHCPPSKQSKAPTWVEWIFGEAVQFWSGFPLLPEKLFSWLFPDFSEILVHFIDLHWSIFLWYFYLCLNNEENPIFYLWYQVLLVLFQWVAQNKKKHRIQA